MLLEGGSGVINEYCLPNSPLCQFGMDLRWEIYHNTPLLEMMGDGDYYYYTIENCLRRILGEIINLTIS